MGLASEVLPFHESHQFQKRRPHDKEVQRLRHQTHSRHFFILGWLLRTFMLPKLYMKMLYCSLAVLHGEGGRLVGRRCNQQLSAFCGVPVPGFQVVPGHEHIQFFSATACYVAWRFVTQRASSRNGAPAWCMDLKSLWMSISREGISGYTVVLPKAKREFNSLWMSFQWKAPGS